MRFRFQENDGSDLPTAFETIAISQNVVAVENKLSQSQKQRTVTRSGDSTIADLSQIDFANTVMLKNDGSLIGNVIATHQATGQPNQILVSRDGQIIFEGMTDNRGAFRIGGLEPGYYDFVSTGPNGFAAFGFKAIESESVFRSASTSVVIQDETPSVLNTPLAANQDLFNDLATEQNGESLSHDVARYDG